MSGEIFSRNFFKNIFAINFILKKIENKSDPNKS